MNKKLFEFLSTQFKNGEPKLWGSFHIISLVISLTIAIILIAALWKTTKKEIATFWILFAFWIILFTIECLKQFYAGSKIDGSGNWYWKYDTRWSVPFVLCSMPLYFIPLYLVTYKTKMFKTIILDFIGVYCLYGGVFVMILYPGDVFTSTIFISTHSMIFHGAMLIIGMFLVINNIIKFSWKTVGFAFLIFMILWAITGIGNEIIWQLHKAGKIDFMPNLLNISHRLQNPFGDAIKNITNGKVKFSDLTIYLAYPLWTFIVSNIIYGFFGFVGWSARKIEASAKLHYETKLQNKAMLRRKMLQKKASTHNNILFWNQCTSLIFYFMSIFKNISLQTKILTFTNIYQFC